MNHTRLSPAEFDAILEPRTEGLEQIARGMTGAQLAALADVIRNEGSEKKSWPTSEAYWFSNRGAAIPRKDEDRVVRRLWTRMLVGLAFAVSGVDSDAVVKRSPRPEGGFIAQLLEGLRTQDPAGHATTLLERNGGPDIYVSAIGVWNAFCAALLTEWLDPTLASALEAPWRTAIGPTPRELLSSHDLR